MYGQGSRKLYNWPNNLSAPHYGNGVHHEMMCLYSGEHRDVSEDGRPPGLGVAREFCLPTTSLRVVIQLGGLGLRVRVRVNFVAMVRVRGFAKLNKFQKSKNNLEVGGWVQVPFG